MKFYWCIVFLLFFVWYKVSLQDFEVSWWSIFSSTRSTHTPMVEQISLIKVTFIALLFLALTYPIRLMIQKRK